MDGYHGVGARGGPDLAEARGDDLRIAAARTAYLDAEARLFLGLAERDGTVGPGAGFRDGCGERLERIRLVHAVGARSEGRWGISARGRAFLAKAPPSASDRIAAWLRGAPDRAADGLLLGGQAAVAALAVVAFWGLWCLAVAIDRVRARIGLDAPREPV